MGGGKGFKGGGKGCKGGGKGGGKGWGGGGGGMGCGMGGMQWDMMWEMMSGMMGGGMMGGGMGMGGMGMGGMDGMDGGMDHASLVQCVKNLQKQGGRDQWEKFVANHGGGMKDPSLRTASELKEFLMTANPMERMGGGMGGGGMDAEHGFLVQRVKQFQKQEGGRDKWLSFCEAKGHKKNDPTLKDSMELKEFLMLVDPESAAAFEANGTAPSAEYGEQVKLAQEVKKGQRASEEFKQAWWTYCETKYQDVRDPAKHDLSSLQAFLSIAPAVVIPEKDPAHEALVQQIKAGQRGSEAFKNAWHSFCDNQGTKMYDPSRQDMMFLQQFLNANPVPEGIEPASKRLKLTEN